MKDIENTRELIKYKEKQATENRQHVLDALIDLCLEGSIKIDKIKGTDTPRSYAPWRRGTQEILGERKWVTVRDILFQSNLKSTKLLEREIMKITKRYEGGYISNIEKVELIEKEKKKYTNVRRTVERNLNYLLKRGLVIRQNHKYSLSNAALQETTYSSSYVGFTALSNLMENLHNSADRTLNENIEQLITFLGCYSFFCLLEGGRPIDDSFVNKVRDVPISKEEKDRLTESWVLGVLQPLMMYKFFLETFLNQIEDPKAREKKGRMEYPPAIASWKAVPLAITPTVLYLNSSPPSGNKGIFYRLDKKMYKKITKTFKKMHPEIYWQLIKGSIGNDPRGAKNNYVRWMSDIPKPFEFD